MPSPASYKTSNLSPKRRRQTSPHASACLYQPPTSLAAQEQLIASPTSPPPPVLIDPVRITTTFDLPGYTISRNLGVVRGLVVRSRNAFGTLGARLQTLLGGNISLFTELGERTRQDAFALMAQHAAELGANAIIGVRYDAHEILQGVTEILAYGTAVVVIGAPDLGLPERARALAPEPPPAR